MLQNQTYTVCFRTILTVFLLPALAGCVYWQGETEEVVFSGGGDIDLYATLAIPNDSEPLLPAIVMLHGAERATRDRFIYRITGNLFLRCQLCQ